MTKVVLELKAGSDTLGICKVVKADVDGQIAALTRAIDNEPKHAMDDVFLIDVRGIMRMIRDQLEER